MTWGHGVKRWVWLAVLQALALAGSATASARTAPPVKTLLDGVRQIGSPGVPGTICVFGPTARAVVVDRNSSGASRPVVAAARWGAGRLVAFGHDGYLSPSALKTADTGRLFLNAVRWTAGAKRNPRLAVLGNPPLARFLTQQGIVAVSSTLDRLRFGGADVVVGKLSRTRPEQIEQLRRFIRQGGGLIAAETGWGWQQLHPHRDLRTNSPANRLLAPMGLVFAADTAHDTGTNGFVVEGVPSELTNAALALDSCPGQRQEQRKLTKAERVQISATLAMALRSVPPADRLILPRLQTALRQRGDEVIPSSRSPVRNTDVLAYLAVAEQARRLSKLAPEQVAAHPAQDGPRQAGPC